MTVGADGEKREHSSPLEEYVRRLTGEIVAKSHGLSQQG